MLRYNLSKLFRGAKPFRQTQQQLTILTSKYKNDWAGIFIQDFGNLAS